MGNTDSALAADGETPVLTGQSLAGHGYRIMSSTLYPQNLHPLIDYIIYDPHQNNGKLMSEHILENIFAAIVQV